MKKDRIFCCLRKEWVAALPEEVVRQSLLSQMVDNLGYPIGNLVLEKSLHQMPHLQNSGVKMPDRRADLVCFAKGIHTDFDLSPLLLIECKAHKLSSKCLDQVAGYNHFLRAVFIALANGQEFLLGWYDPRKAKYQFIDYLPPYLELKSLALSP